MMQLVISGRHLRVEESNLMLMKVSKLGAKVGINSMLASPTVSMLNTESKHLN
jgi:hypothetical protein